MYKNYFFCLVCSFCITTISLGQVKPHLVQKYRSQSPHTTPRQVQLNYTPSRNIPQSTRHQTTIQNFLNGQPFTLTTPVTNDLPGIKVTRCPKTNLPIEIVVIKPAHTLSLRADLPIEKQSLQFLETLQSVMGISQPTEKLQLTNIQQDDQQEFHLRYVQKINNIEVFGSELIVHTQNQRPYRLTGRFIPDQTQLSTAPLITAEQAEKIAWEHLALQERILKNLRMQLVSQSERSTIKPVLYFPDMVATNGIIAWELTMIPNYQSKYRYVIDAKQGEVILNFNELCSAHHSHCSHHATPSSPPEQAFATDLNGTQQLVPTFSVADTFYMIDATKSMFNNVRSSFPNSPSGVIWTLDAKGSSPTNDDFEVAQVTSTNNQWNNAKAVSAHSNASFAYDYFNQTHGRNSIDDEGGNIISVINVSDEDGLNMDNAFWNGAAMFYGNGDQVFTDPLARSLDIAGHEMSHGVIQTEANLNYFEESGAMNESFADVFGAMMDREDWQIAEDVTDSRFFVSGALRDMENPNNGRSRFGQTGWQPKHMDEFIETSEDNGGVHINSGIPNRAFVLFAKQVGKSLAEEVYYEALQNELTRSSQFIDLRIAIVNVATAKGGEPAADAARAAFDAVGILEAEETDVVIEIEANAGDQFILYSDGPKTNLKIKTPDGQFFANPLYESGLLSRPSITDDGTMVVFVDDAGHLQLITIDYNTLDASLQTLSEEPIWRNVAISKKGNRLAAVSEDYDNLIYVFDLSSPSPRGWTFELYNPTTAEGINTGNVGFADVLEWDFSGTAIIYDAFNEIRTLTDSIDYWDIGIINAWDTETNEPGSGFIQKLFASNDRNISIGNPTFAKNSPNLIAFDFIDELTSEYFLRVVNIENGDIGDLYTNQTLNFPNFSSDDNQIIFDGFNSLNRRVVGVITLTEDKLGRTDTPTVFISDDDQARWGVWFANGSRVLTSNEDIQALPNYLKVFPNPTAHSLTIQNTAGTNQRVALYTTLGQEIWHLENPDPFQSNIQIGDFESGWYQLKVWTDEGIFSQSILKF